MKACFIMTNGVFIEAFGEVTGSAEGCSRAGNVSSLLRDENRGFPHTLTRGIYSLLKVLDRRLGFFCFVISLFGC